MCDWIKLNRTNNIIKHPGFIFGDICQILIKQTTYLHKLKYVKVRNVLKLKTLLEWVKSYLILKKKVFILLCYIIVKWNTETKTINLHKLLICFKMSI